MFAVQQVIVSGSQVFFLVVLVLDMERSVGGCGTSHLKRFKSTWASRRNPMSPYNLKFSEFSCIQSYGGLSVMPDRFDRNSLNMLPRNSDYYKEKTRQFNQCIAELGGRREEELLWVALSNDYKTFITDHKGNLLDFSRGAVKKWEGLENKKRAVYNAYISKPWDKPLRVQVQSQFAVYENILQSMLSQSSVKVLHHSSVLERLNPKIEYLNLYFAIINSVLERSLTRWTKEEVFKNKFGCSISCKFVNVKELFYMAPDPERLFISKEIIAGKELTHRTDVAIDEVADIWSSAVTGQVSSES